MAEKMEKPKTFALLSESQECPVCLQPCVHPVSLPCNHIFCYLCAKGLTSHSKKCAMCRKNIPDYYLKSPTLVQDPNPTIAIDGKYQWFYKGSNGWWQYDPRASSEIETAYCNGDKTMKLMIAGFLYIIDLEQMVQYRENIPSRLRRIKRDLIDIPDKKGVAGLSITKIKNASISNVNSSDKNDLVNVQTGNDDISNPLNKMDTVKNASEIEDNGIMNYSYDYPSSSPDVEIGIDTRSSVQQTNYKEHSLMASNDQNKIHQSFGSSFKTTIPPSSSHSHPIPTNFLPSHLNSKKILTAPQRSVTPQVSSTIDQLASLSLSESETTKSAISLSFNEDTLQIKPPKTSVKLTNTATNQDFSSRRSLISLNHISPHQPKLPSSHTSIDNPEILPLSTFMPSTTTKVIPTNAQEGSCNENLNQIIHTPKMYNESIPSSADPSKNKTKHVSENKSKKNGGNQESD